MSPVSRSTSSISTWLYLSLGKEDVAAHGEILAHFLGFECDRLKLLIRLLIGLRLAFFSTAEHAPCTAECGPDQGPCARVSETPPATASAGNAGDASQRPRQRLLHLPR